MPQLVRVSRSRLLERAGSALNSHLVPTRNWFGLAISLSYSQPDSRDLPPDASQMKRNPQLFCASQDWADQTEWRPEFPK